jgi:hypothetical protein
MGGLSRHSATGRAPRLHRRGCSRRAIVVRVCPVHRCYANRKTYLCNALDWIRVQLGDLTSQNAFAAQDDLRKQGYDARILGHPVLFRLGEEIFNQVAVDIDFSHYRVAFCDPATLIKPIGAIEVPLVELDGERVLPLSVNGKAPKQFELELGNVIGSLDGDPGLC